MATQQTAVTALAQYIIVDGTKLAYRRLGLRSGIPLVMLIHFRGNMDFWDPALIDALAESRPIILLDNAGIGKSEGEIPTTLQGWAAHVIGLLRALNTKQIDLLGFSMGGGAAQHVALAAPGLVRKLILAGTCTSRTPNTIIGPRKIFVTLASGATEEGRIQGGVNNIVFQSQRSWSSSSPGCLGSHLLQNSRSSSTSGSCAGQTPDRGIFEVQRLES
jgi:pimeloyl-ACP methyl ester carboxylesterase